MAYTVVLARQAQRAIARLPSADAQRMYAATQALAQNPRPAGCVKLTGSPDWRIRVGSYRVIYAIDDAAAVVTVLKVGHRREVYR